MRDPRRLEGLRLFLFARIAPFAAAALRYSAAMVAGFACLLALLLGLSRELEGSVSSAPIEREFSAAAIEYDRAVLEALSDWVLEGDAARGEQSRSEFAAEMFAIQETLPPIVAVPSAIEGAKPSAKTESAPFFWPLRAPASVVSHALRGIAEVLPMLLGALVLLLALAALSGVIGAKRPFMSNRLGSAGIFGVALVVLVSLPAANVEIFSGGAAHRAQSWIGAITFVAAFAGVASRVALSGVLARYSSVRFFESIRGQPLPGVAARIAASEAALALVPAVPVATIATAFAILAGQRNAELGGASELMMRTVASPKTLWWNGSVLTLTLAFISLSGILFLFEIRRALQPAARERSEAARG